jgi:hypothetical protein
VCLEKIENEDGLCCSALLFPNRDNNIIFLIDAKKIVILMIIISVVIYCPYA